MGLLPHSVREITHVQIAAESAIRPSFVIEITGFSFWVKFQQALLRDECYGPLIRFERTRQQGQSTDYT